MAYLSQMKDPLHQFKTLLTKLHSERVQLETRLNEINTVLGAVTVTGATPPAFKAVAGKKTFSAATKAKMAAAQKARWAKIKGSKASAPLKKTKNKLSAAGRAAIVAAQKARWAKIKAAKAGK